MEVLFLKNEIRIRMADNVALDALTLNDNHAVIIEKQLSSTKKKKAVVNSLIYSLWKTQKTRQKYYI